MTPEQFEFVKEAHGMLAVFGILGLAALASIMVMLSSIIHLLNKKR